MRDFLFFVLILVLFFGCAQQEETNIKGTHKATGFFRFGLSTNTAISSVNLTDIISGGPGKDGIPAIRNPKFTFIGDASTTVKPETLGIVVGANGANETNEKKFYPYNILVWHEVVDDSIDDQPVAITFCPLCGSAIVFSRIVNGKTLNFGVSGLLYQSNLLMYDNETESLWSQVRSEAVVGDYTGKKLRIINSQLMNFSEFKLRYPGGKVLSTDTGYQRDYSFYPYGDYDTNNDIYFPIKKYDKMLPLKEIVYAIHLDDKHVVIFPLNALSTAKKAELDIDGKHIVVSSHAGELVALVDGKETPGYYAMYFSIVAQEENVAVWK